ncbi:MAG: ammonia-forming cytochrome c nitrite reductase subunit c552 [Micrococcales bacterium]|nr:ammonia-forming cytochrome c nitrite reductase subunit c552 [Micrococcales bacterium]
MSETDKAYDLAPRRRIWPLVLVAAVAALVTAGLAYLIANIGDRKAEGEVSTYSRVVPLTNETWDPAEWGKNYPTQYDAYRLTRQITPTHHVSAWVPITDDERRTKDAGNPPEADAVLYEDARSQLTGDDAKVTPSKLGEDPRLKTFWNGYAFAKDYRHLRGHEWMLIDQQQTLRVLALVNRPADKGGPQPGACANCHASVPEIVNILGGGNSEAQRADGWAQMNSVPYTELVNIFDAKAPAGTEMGPIACVDCHDAETMKLRITRPALINALKALKQDENYDVNTQATNNEMRSYVCAQCHVEYYFKGGGYTLTFPWHHGSTVNGAWEYYENVEIPNADGEVKKGFTDFGHGDTGARVLKAQHPEFEMWSQGVHADNKVACADCHMAFVRDGGQKVSNHRIASPMADVNGSCGTCHPGSTVELEARVNHIQTRYLTTRDRSMNEVMSFISALKDAKDAGTVSEDVLALAQKYHNFANFYMDYAYSENSYGFHAPDYFQEIMGQAVLAASAGQRLLLGVPQDQVPTFSQLLGNKEPAPEPEA